MATPPPAKPPELRSTPSSRMRYQRSVQVGWPWGTFEIAAEPFERIDFGQGSQFSTIEAASARALGEALIEAANIMEGKTKEGIPILDEFELAAAAAFEAEQDASNEDRPASDPRSRPSPLSEA